MAIPVASFTVTPAFGDGPLTVAFKNTSLFTGTYTSFFWEFNDEKFQNSTDENPPPIVYVNSDKYGSKSYFPTLTATNLVGQSTTASQEVIVVGPEEPFPLWAIILLSIVAALFLILIIYFSVRAAKRASKK